MNNSQDKSFIYDEVSYPELCYSLTHPGRVAAIGTLLGLRPPAVEHCRVLEIGCAGGGNLVPMAHSLPGSSFLGIDLSERQIDSARQSAAALGLSNLQFRHMNLIDLDPELGEFDYIIAHGVYSWVPGPVRDRLLAACKRHLAADGIAYVSYNTLPGWNNILSVREMINVRTRHLSDPREKVREGREFIASILAMVPHPEQSPFALFLKDYIATRFRRFSDRSDWEESMLLHDELSTVNDPVYFHQFATHAASHGLQYLAEADFPRVMPNDIEPENAAKLQQMSLSVVDFEQYMDFVRDQTFRATLLVHDNVPIKRQLDGEKLRGLYVSSRTRFVRDEDGKEFFRTAEDARWPAEEAITSAALLHLESIAPRAAHFNDLFKAACQMLNLSGTPEQAASVLADDLLAAFCVDTQLVELLAYDPACASIAPEHPEMSSVARHQARQSRIVSNLRHEQTELDTTTSLLAPLLDGQHDRKALLQALASRTQGAVTITEQGAAKVPEGTTVDEALARELEQGLATLAAAALLLA